MKTLVLGGSVFVGRRLVELLVAGGHEVTVLNRGRTAVDLPDGVGRLVADRTDADAMATALTGTNWDAVFDVSGFVMAAGGGDISTLLDLVDGSAGAYVYVSSIMAYDQSLVGPVEERPVPWTEDLPTNPSGAESYGGFKATAEAALLARHARTGFPATILRPAAIYGPGNNIFDMETPMFLRLRRHLPILLPHQGRVTGSYGHVDDLCALMIRAATSGDAVGSVVNATTTAASAEQYVRVLAEVVGAEPDLVIVPAQDSGRQEDGSSGGPTWCHLFDARHHAVLDTGRAEQLLGDRPRFDLHDGHADTYDWFLRQGWGELDHALVDPTWRATWDFEAEAALAEAIRS